MKGNDAPMAVFDNRQMNKMRQDAIRRSQEMHRRPMAPASNYSQGHHERTDIPPPVTQTENSHNRESEYSNVQNRTNTSNKKDNQISEMLGKLLNGKIDSDKLIIIALIVILIREGADMKLILALGYILL